MIKRIAQDRHGEPILHVHHVDPQQRMAEDDDELNVSALCAFISSLLTSLIAAPIPHSQQTAQETMTIHITSQIIIGYMRGRWDT